MNMRFRAGQSVRVLLGDPPIDWDNIRSVQELQKWAEMRDRHAVEVIQREVLSKQRRALMIYGDGHLVRKSARSNYERDDLGPMVDHLGDIPEASVFSIWVDTATDLPKLQPDVASWKAPRLVLFRGTHLGAADFMDYWRACCGEQPRFAIRNGIRTEIPKDQWRSRRMENQFDALLYLGPPSTMTQTRLSPAVCADDAYMQVRLGRMALVGQPTEGLKNYCAGVPRKVAETTAHHFSKICARICARPHLESCIRTASRAKRRAPAAQVTYTKSTSSGERLKDSVPPWPRWLCRSTSTRRNVC